jgi:hypothetical protein
MIPPIRADVKPLRLGQGRVRMSASREQSRRALIIAASRFLTPKWTSAVFDLGSLSPFVYRSLVTPDKFGVRVVMVPPHARFAAVPIAVRLNGTLCFRSVGVRVVGTKHISSPLRARQRLAACDSSPGGCRKPGTYCRYQTWGQCLLFQSRPLTRGFGPAVLGTETFST